jgi:hypothetical protein
MRREIECFSEYSLPCLNRQRRRQQLNSKLAKINLTNINTNHRVRRVKEELCERLRKQGLALKTTRVRLSQECLGKSLIKLRTVPLGPTKRNDAIGRSWFDNPERERRMASETALTASS